MATAAAAAHAVMIQALKASGTLIRIEPTEFQKLVNKSESPLVITAPGGIFTRYIRYLTSYKGLTFYTQSAIPLSLPSKAEVVAARAIWIPS